MSWFTTTAEQFGKTPSATPGYDDGSGRVSALSGGGLQPSAGGTDYQSTFMSIVGNGLATPDALIAKEQELAAAGIKVLRNASGVAGKVQLPTGEIVDVIQSAGTGGGVAPFTWQQGRGGPTGEGGKPLPGNMYYGQGGSGSAPLSSVAGGGVNYQSRMGSLRDTPGYQFVMDEAMGALQRSQAAKGTLLTGGAMKELQDRAGGIASLEFNNEFGRNLSLANLGMSAAGGQGAYGSSYGNQLTDLTTGAGNARAAGTVGAGNAWTSGLVSIGQMGVDLYGMSRYPPYPPRY
jgi:hypothetical protein